MRANGHRNRRLPCRRQGRWPRGWGACGNVAAIAANPLAGDEIKGAGGARKVRFAGKGRGKSGGYRVVTFFAAQDIPVFLLALVSKGDRADISQAERNELKKELGAVAEDYRAGAKARSKR